MNHYITILLLIVIILLLSITTIIIIKIRIIIIIIIRVIIIIIWQQILFGVVVIGFMFTHKTYVWFPITNSNVNATLKKSFPKH